MVSKGRKPAVAPLFQRNAVNFSHCARYVFLSPRSTGFCAIWDCISSSSLSLSTKSAPVANRSGLSGPQVVLRSHLDLNPDVASLLAVSSAVVGFSLSCPSLLVLVAALLLPFQPLPPPLLPVNPLPLLPPPSSPPPRPRCPFASLPLLPLSRCRWCPCGYFLMVVCALFLLFLLLRRRRLQKSLRRIFRFRLRFATDMRDGAVGACRGKGAPWRLTLVHVLWHG